MATIILKTTIKAPIEKVFDLSLDIGFHTESTSQTKETVIAGVISGHIGLNETVTWRGKHFGVFLKHTSRITELTKPTSFTDEMIRGHFTSFKHDHSFKQEHDTTVMTDVLNYKIPFGILGRLIDNLLVEKHLTKFLKTRNVALKEALED